MWERQSEMEEIYPVETRIKKGTITNKDFLESLQKAASQGGRKRVFLGLLAISCGLVCLILLCFFIVPWLWSGAAFIEPFSIFLGISGIIFLVWFSLTLIYHIYTGRLLPGIKGARRLCVRFFLPLMEMLGPHVGIDRNQVRRSFIKVNNEFVCSNLTPVSPEKLLVLLPHCIQNSKCKRRLEIDLTNCADCGKCQIKTIRKLAVKYGFRVAIATGGTIARRIVAQMRPERIIAIACERDLATGIQDTYPLQVFGILNSRPEGPCINTCAPMSLLEDALTLFLFIGKI